MNIGLFSAPVVFTRPLLFAIIRPLIVDRVEDYVARAIGRLTALKVDKTRTLACTPTEAGYMCA